MLDQLKPVDNRRLYQQIADQIRALIRNGDFAPGTRLPPERDLAQQLGVSRPSVREALIALEIEGAVEVRMGAGVYACVPPQRAPAATAVMGESPTELMQARAAVEGVVVQLASARASADTLRPVHDALAAMRADIRHGRLPLASDRAFHVAIAAMTGNSVLVRLVGELFDERHSPISQQISARAESQQTWMAALQEHEAILAALENRDVILAQTAMLSHLDLSRRRWVEHSRQEWS
ncbi:FadR family transcriptional regulator (plasmid) [Cupriavidus necator]|uniref:FadR family transcriptional regulator n=1 Tax=Cupriavidus necator TaxID=106590 RepID=A0A367PTF8_CUPNE|nr:FadR/GntR family transcriptional regulator [Cupriavidus necator]QQX89469.1 FadR family transcriptional regulator [Cupriavidus necator]RCJ10346.1 FadR family transcriptional regulator [Cupriavidus necator]